MLCGSASLSKIPQTRNCQSLGMGATSQAKPRVGFKKHERHVRHSTPKYPLRDLKYHLMETIRLVIKVHWGLLEIIEIQGSFKDFRIGGLETIGRQRTTTGQVQVIVLSLYIYIYIIYIYVCTHFYAIVYYTALCHVTLYCQILYPTIL